jgi:hypothetical protein
MSSSDRRPAPAALVARRAGRRTHGAALALALLTLAAACRIEDRTPAGSRRDDAAIQAVLAEYHRDLAARDWRRAADLAWRGATYAGLSAAPAGGAINRVLPLDSALAEVAHHANALDPDSYDVRIVRTDVHQEGDLAAAWVTTRRRARHGGQVADEEWVEHFVLRRIAGGWRILTVARAQHIPREGR